MFLLSTGGDSHKLQERRPVSVVTLFSGKKSIKCAGITTTHRKNRANIKLSGVCFLDRSTVQTATHRAVSLASITNCVRGKPVNIFEKIQKSRTI